MLHSHVEKRKQEHLEVMVLYSQARAHFLRLVRTTGPIERRPPHRLPQPCPAANDMGRARALVHGTVDGSVGLEEFVRERMLEVPSLHMALHLLCACNDGSCVAAG